MANASAFDQGWNIGSQRAQEQRAVKQAHAETAWEDQHSDLREAVKNNLLKLSNLPRPDPKSPTYAQDQAEYEAAHTQGRQDLTNSIQAYQDFTKQPHVWDKIRASLGMDGKPHPQTVTTTPSAVQLPPSASGPTELAATPAYTPASLPSQRKEVSGVEVTTLPSTSVASQTLPADKPVTVKGPSKTPHQLKVEADALQKAQKQAGLMEAGGPPSAEDQAVTTANANTAGNMATVLGSLRTFEKLNPNATPEEKQNFRSELIRKQAGLSTKTNLKLFTLPNGNVEYLDADRPDLIPPGTTAYVKPDAFSQLKADYDADPRPPAEKGTLEEYKARITQRPKTAWGKDNGKFYSFQLDPSNQEVPGSRNYNAVPPTSLVGRITEGHYYWTDPATGELHDQPRTGYSGPAGGGGRSPSPVSGNSASSSAGSQSPRSSSSGTSASVASGGASGGKDKIIGHKGTKDEIDTKTAYEGAVDRVKIMEKNLKNAIDKQDQQAMLSLVANHIGMTLGAQKGARINQAVWNEAVSSVPMIDKIEAKWGPDGYLSGVTLAPEQMKQMVELAHERTDILKEHLDRLEQQRKEQESPKGPGDVKNQANKQQWAKAPDIGTVEDGHKYNGGDPADPKNWSKVKQ